MGAGYVKMAHDKMTNDGFGSSEGIYTDTVRYCCNTSVPGSSGNLATTAIAVCFGLSN